VEITSRSDRTDADWDEQVVRYRELGVIELVRFDPPTGVLRIWDRLEGDLVERVIEHACSPSLVAGATWIVVSHDGRPALRLATDATGTVLLPTPEEVANQRIAEFEALLRQRGE